MPKNQITENIFYIGADDKDIDLFESQYKVPNGISYNSYIIKDEKTVIMDTIDKRKTKEWLQNLENTLEGKIPDYLVISHLEPDHAYNIEVLTQKYPQMKLIGNDKTFAFLPQFFEILDLDNRKIVVKEGDEICLGTHTLQFFMAPMVHWPEVMVTYEKTEKILFSADGFGKFGSLDIDENWEDEARRYYINIVRKIWCTSSNVVKKIRDIRCKNNLPIAWSNFERKLRILYWKICYLE